MNTQKTVLRKLMILTICLTVFFVFNRYGYTFYQTNDDEALNLIAAGAYGTGYSQYLIYINIIAGWFLRICYQLFPSVNWYYSISLALNITGIYCIAECQTREKSMFDQIWVTFLINALLSYDYYGAFQFTKNAFLYSAAGWLLFSSYLKHRNTRDAVLSWLMLVVGFCCRRQSFLFTIPFAAVSLTLQILRSGRTVRDHRYAFRHLGIIMACCMILFAADRQPYRLKEWQTYEKVNQYTTNILDFGGLKYSKHEQELRSLNISETDMKILQSWNYGDPDKFTPDTLEQMAAMQGKRFSAAKFSTYAQRSLSGIIDLITGKQNLTIFVLIMSVIAILTRKKQALILTVSAWLVILMEYMFLQSLHRVPWRVTIGIWLMAGVILAEWLSSNTVYKNKAVKALLCLVFGFASVFCFQKHYIFMHMMKDKPDFDHFFTVIRHEHPDQFYLGDVETFCDRAMAADYAAVNAGYAGRYANFMFLGGWEIPSPMGCNYAKQHDIINPYKALIERDDVLLANSHEDTVQLIEDYLQEYDPSVTLEQVDEIDGIAIWKAKR